MPTPRRGNAGSPATTPPVAGLPPSHTPTVAAYAPGPFLVEQTVTPSDIRWMNARTYIVRNATDRQEYRALRVHDQSNQFVGYWAIELMPQPLYYGVGFEGDRQDAIDDYNAAQEQKYRDAKRRKLRGSDDTFEGQ